MAINPLISMGVRVPDFDNTDRRLKRAHADLYEGQAKREAQRAEEEAATNEALKQIPANFGQTDVDDMMRTKPQVAMGMQKMLHQRGADKIAAEKASYEAEEAKLKSSSAKFKQSREQLAAWTALTDGVTDESSFYRALRMGLDQGLPMDSVRQMVDRGYNPEEVKQFSSQMRTAKERIDLEEALETKAFQAKKRPLELLDAENKAKEGTRTGPNNETPKETAERNAPTAKEKDFKTFYADYLAAKGIPDSGQARFEARKEFDMPKRAPVPGVDLPLPAAVVAQRKDIASSGRAAAGSVDVGDNDPMVMAVLKDPLALDNLTPTERTRITPALSRLGFDQFGKPLSNGAIDKMAETSAAVASLQDLRKTLQENEEFIGPIAGFAAINPYSSAKQAQAKINLVRQRVGKALEGGVLRKEDEEKYKLILSTLNDTPETAIAKVDGLISTLERDAGIYRDQQKAAGRRIPASAKPAGDGKDLSKLSTEELLKMLVVK